MKGGDRGFWIWDFGFGIEDLGLRICNYGERNWVEVEYEDKAIAAILRPFHQKDLFRGIREL
jgi:hypothetical protein